MSALRRVLLILFLAGVILLTAAQIASSFLLKPILERQAGHLFQVPVYVDQAGANLFAGSFWMKGVRIKNARGFQESDFLTARTISINVNFPSLLTSEFVVSRILLKDPVFTFEVNGKGQSNVSQFAQQISDRFQRFLERKPKLIRLITRFTLEKFAVRNGVLQIINQQEPEQNLNFKSISFSLARLVYPPDPEEALPAAFYVNATVPGIQEGKILLLGRLNPFVPKKSFDITGSAKGLEFNRYSAFFPDFPFRFKEGTLQLKVKALCHENQVDIYNQVRLEGLRLTAKEFRKRKPPLVFDLAPETVLHFFNDLQPATEPFEFDFRVTGDLGNPRFNVFSAVGQRFRQTINDRVTNQMKAIDEKAKKISQGDIAEITEISLRGAERRGNL